MEPLKEKSSVETPPEFKKEVKRTTSKKKITNFISSILGKEPQETRSSSPRKTRFQKQENQEISTTTTSSTPEMPGVLSSDSEDEYDSHSTSTGTTEKEEVKVSKETLPIINVDRPSDEEVDATLLKIKQIIQKISEFHQAIQLESKKETGQEELKAIDETAQRIIEEMNLVLAYLGEHPFNCEKSSKSTKSLFTKKMEIDLFPQAIPTTIPYQDLQRFSSLLNHRLVDVEKDLLEKKNKKILQLFTRDESKMLEKAPYVLLKEYRTALLFICHCLESFHAEVIYSALSEKFFQKQKEKMGQDRRQTNENKENFATQVLELRENCALYPDDVKNFLLSLVKPILEKKTHTERVQIKKELTKCLRIRYIQNILDKKIETTRKQSLSLEEQTSSFNLEEVHQKAIEETLTSNIESLNEHYFNLAKTYTKIDPLSSEKKDLISSIKKFSEKYILFLNKFLLEFGLTPYEFHLQRTSTQFSKKEITINLFPPGLPLLMPQELASKVTTFLNQELFLYPRSLKEMQNSLLKGQNRIKINQSVRGASSLIERYEKHKPTENEYTLGTFQLLFQHREAILRFVEQLRNPSAKEDEGAHTLESILPENSELFSKFEKLMAHLDEETKQKYFQEVADAIQSFYVENCLVMPSLNSMIVSLAKHCMKGFQAKDLHTPYLYSEFQKKVEQNMKGQDIKNPFGGFFRAVMGSIAIFQVIEKGVIRTILEPFKIIEGEDPVETQKRVIIYIHQCEEIVGEYIFGDKTLIRNFTEAVSKAAFKIKSDIPEAPKEQGILGIHARNFLIFLQAMKDPIQAEKLFNEIDETLKETNPETMQKEIVTDPEKFTKGHVTSQMIAEKMMLFYTATDQVFIHGALMFINAGYTYLFQDILSHNSSLIKKLDWDHKEISQLCFQFVLGSHLKIKSAKTFTLQTEDCFISQYTTFNNPLLQTPPLKEPVSSYFDYASPKDILPSQMRRLKVNIRSIQTYLAGCEFPNLKQLKNMK